MTTYAFTGYAFDYLRESDTTLSINQAVLEITVADAVDTFSYTVTQEVEPLRIPGVDLATSLGQAEGLYAIQIGGLDFTAANSGLVFRDLFPPDVLFGLAQIDWGDGNVSYIMHLEVPGDPAYTDYWFEIAGDPITPFADAVADGPGPGSTFDEFVAETSYAGEVIDPEGPQEDTPIAWEDLTLLSVREDDDFATRITDPAVTVFGGAGDDDLRNDGAANLDGGPGDDRLQPGVGSAAEIDGGPGDDTLATSVQLSNLQVTDLGNGTVRIAETEFGSDFTVSNVEFFDFDATSVSLDELLFGPSTPGETITGTEGSDTLDGTDNDDEITGGEGDDTLAGGAGNDRLDGGAGDDLVSGGDGNDLVAGGPGDDGVQGQDGRDSLDGGAGNDNLSGSTGNDLVLGGAGDDLMGGGLGKDTMDGGADNDFMGGGQGDDSVAGGAGNDVVNGGPGDDTLEGGPGNDTMGGSFGNDVVRGNAGDDDMGGGAGSNTISGGDGNDSAGGGEGNDVISGGAGDDFLAGGGRDDSIDGGSGDDLINAGDGDDTMEGGEGADLFIFNGFRDGDADVITDFEDGVDRFRMTGVENAPGSGNAGRVTALNITDTEFGAEINYEGHTVLITGVTAAELGTEDFIFL